MSIKVVAVIDDDQEAADTIISTLEDGDFVAFHQRELDSIEALVSAIMSSSDAAVCDHRLRYGGFADISGADLAARLIRQSHPTILVTTYLDQDAGIAIRSFRPDLPVVLRREDADEPAKLRSAFARCIAEIEKGKRDDRTAQRTLLQVKYVDTVKETSVDDAIVVVDAIVHGWNHSSAVRFPLTLVQEGDRDKVRPGVTLSAITNLRATQQADLYFLDVMLAEDVDPNDGLQ